MLNGAVRPNLSASTTYGEARSSWLQRSLQATAGSWCRLGRVSDSARLADVAEPPQGFRCVGEQFAGVGEMLDQRRNVGEQPVQRVVVVRDDGQQVIGRIDCAGEVVALTVQFGGECVQPLEEFADLIDVAVKDVEDLGLNHVEVRDATTIEDYRDAGQRPFDGGVGRGVRQADGVAALQRLRRRIARRGQLDVLRAQQAGLADLRGRVRR